MKYLLDTHTFIWSILDTEKLSTKVKDLLSNPKIEIYVSTISFWEIALKTQMNKYSFDGLLVNDLPVYADKIGYSTITLDRHESSTFCNLPYSTGHKDPFDRLLVWQAICRDFIFISKDSKLKIYFKDGLRTCW
jgi:PIN domain nuclease of toxin-antitoxin system